MQLNLNLLASARCGIRQHKTPSLQNNNNKLKALFTSYRYDFHSSTKHNIFTMCIKSVFRHYSNVLEAMYLDVFSYIEESYQAAISLESKIPLVSGSQNFITVAIYV